MDRRYTLRVSNYEYFIATYTNTGEHYKSPHQILAELEQLVCYSERPEPMVLISYKDWGDVIFDYDRIVYDGCDTFLVYQFSTTCS